MAVKFTTVTGVAAPLLHADINTDIIAPTQRPSKKGASQQFGEKGAEGLGRDLFAGWRYDENDNEIPDFILNQPAFRDACILLAGRNFACGSSRESAVWMLYDFGIRCVIAPSFGEIFYNNCFKNGLLPIRLPEPVIRDLAEQAAPDPAGTIFSVDLNTNIIKTPAGQKIEFKVPAILRQGLLEGLDEISLTLQRKAEIDAYMDRAQASRPWMYFPESK